MEWIFLDRSFRFKHSKIWIGGGSGTTTAALAMVVTHLHLSLSKQKIGMDQVWTEVNDLATARYNAAGSGSGTSRFGLSGGGVIQGSETAATEEWAFSGLDPSTTPAADYANAITGDFYYNSTTGQFKTVNTGGAPIGTWASGGNLNTARYVGGGAGTKHCFCEFSRWILVHHGYCIT